MPEKQNPARSLLQLFFKAPLVNALLVFEDNEYLGVLFKKDIEIGIRENSFHLSENINFIDAGEVRDLFWTSDRMDQALQIPVINKEGHLLRIISQAEFNSQFYFNHFLDDFSLEHIWDHLDHPLIITNHFKRILYLNKKAFLMSGKDLLGLKINQFLNQFEMEIKEDRMIISRFDHMYHLLITQSESGTFEYHIYQFFEI